jgi:hypothetical protein
MRLSRIDTRGSSYHQPALFQEEERRLWQVR